MDDVRIFFCKSNDYWFLLEMSEEDNISKQLYKNVNSYVAYRLIEQKETGEVRLQTNVEWNGKKQTIIVPEEMLYDLFEEYV